MTLVRCFAEMGMGVDVRGRDYTKAARRAVADAIRHSSINVFRLLDRDADEMVVDVTVAGARPEAVDTAAVAAELPHGTVRVTHKVVSGDVRSGPDAEVAA